MAKALGIGGVFFKAPDPRALAQWYGRWLGLEIEPSFGGTCFKAAHMPEGGYTIWSPFKQDTTYFEPSQASFMINLVVDDLEKALGQVEEGGATLAGEPEESVFGRFGWFIDPAGNKVELWQPPA